MAVHKSLAKSTYISFNRMCAYMLNMLPRPSIQSPLFNRTMYVIKTIKQQLLDFRFSSIVKCFENNNDDVCGMLEY